MTVSQGQMAILNVGAGAACLSPGVSPNGVCFQGPRPPNLSHLSLSSYWRAYLIKFTVCPCASKEAL